jgi:hypothetical protein
MISVDNSALKGKLSGAGGFIEGASDVFVGIGDKIVGAATSKPVTGALKLGAMTGVETLKHGAGLGLTIGNKMIKEKSPWNFKLSGWGKAAAAIMAIGSFAKNTSDTYDNIHMGSINSNVRTNTPSIAPYMNMRPDRGVDMAGATGDLVFALHKNRNTGYL